MNIFEAMDMFKSFFNNMDPLNDNMLRLQDRRRGFGDAFPEMLSLEP